MIIKGGSHSGRGLGSYLLQQKNERVEVWAIRGDLPRDLGKTLEDWRSDALGTHCQKPLYHAQLNPDRALSREEWEQAITLFEKELGFENQPRAIVLHEYKGREHLHLVYSRLDQDGKAISDSWNYLHHEKAAREIEAELGLEQTQGVLYQAKDKTRPERTPDEAAIQQGERTEIDPKQVKEAITEIYKSAEGNAAAFLDSLKQEGYTIAKGDKRGFVVVDQAGGVHSLTRAAGAKAGELKQLLGDPDKLPSVDEVREATEAKLPDSVEQQAPAAEEISNTYWQDKINAERVKQDAEPPPISPPVIDPTESKAAQSAFADPLTLTHIRHIEEQGEVKHSGLVLSWVEHAAGAVQELGREFASVARNVVGITQKAWHNLADRFLDKGDIEPDR